METLDFYRQRPELLGRRVFRDPELVRFTSLQSTILDGEIVALDSERNPTLQIAPTLAKESRYYLLDLLWSEGASTAINRPSGTSG